MVYDTVIGDSAVNHVGELSSAGVDGEDPDRVVTPADDVAQIGDSRVLLVSVSATCVVAVVSGHYDLDIGVFRNDRIVDVPGAALPVVGVAPGYCTFSRQVMVRVDNDIVVRVGCDYLARPFRCSPARGELKIDNEPLGIVCLERCPGVVDLALFKGPTQVGEISHGEVLIELLCFAN